jgi:hypothetical protein
MQATGQVRRIPRAMAVALVVLMLVPAVNRAVAAPQRRGTAIACRARASRLAGEITVTFWLNSPHAHRRWLIRIWDRAERVYSDVSRTDFRGKIRVRTVAANQRGRDIFRFNALDLVSGDVCKVDDLRL